MPLLNTPSFLSHGLRAAALVAVFGAGLSLGPVVFDLAQAEARGGRGGEARGPDGPAAGAPAAGDFAGGGGRPPRGPADVDGDGDVDLVDIAARLDRDDNGVIDASDLNGPRFDRLDTNDDGVIDAAEIAARFDADGDGAIDPRPDRGRPFLSDQDGDGDVDAEDAFARLDRDDDGDIDGDDITARGLARFDTDGDGMVTLAELQARFEG